MNKDTHLIFEALMSSQKIKDIKGHSTEAEIEKLLNYLRQDYSSGLGLDNETLGDVIHEIEDIIRSGTSAHGSEDAESDEKHCAYAAKGCDCGECEGCQDNAMKGEDAESSNVDVDTLIDTIKEYQVKKGNREYAYSYVVGVLSSIIKEALHSPKNLQSSINRSYQSFTEKK
jgi:hypothetical protein